VLRAGRPGDATSAQRVDVDFSLALHNRTGKYFIGRDVIGDHADRVGRIRYWRTVRRAAPTGLEARLIGRAFAIEAAARQSSPTFDRALPRLRPDRPVLHLDPFTVVGYQLRPSDIVLCHDLGPITHPQLFGPGMEKIYAMAYREIRSAGPHVVFVSRASRAAYHHLYGDTLASSRVIYPSIRSEVHGRRDMTPLAAAPSRFLLSVGSIGARKNQQRLIRAYRRSGLFEEDVGLVICGGREPGYDAVAAEAAGAAGVQLLAYVDDQTLNWLYAHALGFALPSLLEGFGVPVAEAVARGLVPMVTRGGVLEEVAGEGAVLVDANDEASIAQGLLTLARLGDEERARRLSRLSGSLRRFSRARFSAEWAAVLSDACAPTTGARPPPRTRRARGEALESLVQ
jgi:glycosyltransferase involved in cell wall biosynthesis